MTATTLALIEAAKAPTGEAAKSGPWGFAIILVLCVACYFLFKSMSKHMRRVREDFPTGKESRTRTAETASGDTASAELPADSGRPMSSLRKGDQPPADESAAGPEA